MDIRARELLRRLGEDEVLVLDCRTDDEWQRLPVHIPGALRMSLSELDEDGHVLPDDELIVVYCFDPDGALARRACRILRLRGRSAVCLDGGLRGWVMAGFPIERHDELDHPALAVGGSGEHVRGT